MFLPKTVLQVTGVLIADRGGMRRIYWSTLSPSNGQRYVGCWLAGCTILLLVGLSFIKTCMLPNGDVSQPVAVSETWKLILHHHPFFRAMTSEGGRNYLEVRKSGRFTFYRLADTLSGDIPDVDVYEYQESLVLLAFNRIRSVQKYTRFLLNLSDNTIATLTYDGGNAYAVFLGKGEDQMRKVVHPWYRSLDGSIYPECKFYFGPPTNDLLLVTVEQMMTNATFAGSLTVVGGKSVSTEN